MSFACMDNDVTFKEFIQPQLKEKIATTWGGEGNIGHSLLSQAVSYKHLKGPKTERKNCANLLPFPLPGCKRLQEV